MIVELHSDQHGEMGGGRGWGDEGIVSCSLDVSRWFISRDFSFFSFSESANRHDRSTWEDESTSVTVGSRATATFAATFCESTAKIPEHWR